MLTYHGCSTGVNSGGLTPFLSCFLSTFFVSYGSQPGLSWWSSCRVAFIVCTGFSFSL